MIFYIELASSFSGFPQNYINNPATCERGASQRRHHVFMLAKNRWVGLNKMMSGKQYGCCRTSSYLTPNPWKNNGAVPADN